mgnify:CR=1 FL=1
MYDLLPNTCVDVYITNKGKVPSAVFHSDRREHSEEKKGCVKTIVAEQTEESKVPSRV